MSAEEVKAQEPVAAAEPAVAGTKRKETEPAVPVANDTEETSEKKEQEAESAAESKPKEKETVAEPEESKEVAEPATEEPPKKKAKSKKTKGKAKSRYADIQGDDDDDDDDDDDENDDNIENYDELKNDDADDSFDEMDTSNIIQGRRTRGKVIDYKKTLEKIEKQERAGITDELLDDEDEENDGNYVAPAEE